MTPTHAKAKRMYENSFGDDATHIAFEDLSGAEHNSWVAKAALESAGLVKGSRKHNHYYKDVSKLDYVDVYRVLELFGVIDPCIQHAVKKLLVTGGRGVKDHARDIQDVIDTLVRHQEMQEEQG